MATTVASSSNPFDFVLRVIESVAFSLHAVLGITEPWTHCLRGAFGDHNNMVWWGWPVAGLLLASVAFANIRFAHNDTVMLVVQWYVVTFHCGAFWYHTWGLHHPWAVGLVPGLCFVPMALGIIAIRIEDQGGGLWWWMTMPVGMVAAVILSRFLCLLLVQKAPSRNDAGMGDRSSSERCRPEHPLLTSNTHSNSSNNDDASE